MRKIIVLLSLFCMSTLFVSKNSFADRPDILVADFEGENYGDGWKIEGTAFGTGPAKGKIDGQMNVTGFLGKGLVNSFHGGDDPKGKLTSPTFKIERPFLSFLIGGGGHEGLAMNLIVDGKTIRTATGPNIVPGGNENLDWMDWDLADQQGKDAFIEIVDDRSGGWGHINVDHIIQTSQKRASVEKRAELIAEKEFLYIPISMHAPVTWIRVEVDGVWQQEFDCPLLVNACKPDFFASIPIGQWKGKKITLIAEKVPHESYGLTLLEQSDELPHGDTIYTERYRPQFHFSPRIGWANDPNGLVYYKGTWHLFYQHNPFSTKWGNMTWGHATSLDLLHWTEHADAIQPDKLGTIFSGSAVVDGNNTSGFQNGNEKPIVAIFTQDGGSARFGHRASQGIAYSTDGGKTFVKYDKNPVLPHIVGGNRDPKVIWYEPTKRWIMALYMDKEDYALFESPDLKNWDKICDIPNLGCSECPDFFPLAVDGDKNNVKWVFWGGNGKYLLGSFDGKTFTKETEPLQQKYGGNDYAAMTFSDAPDGRRIQLSWMSGGKYPGMPFNQQFTVPREFTLRTTPKGVRLFTNPVKELETLRGDVKEQSIIYDPDKGESLIPFDGDLFDAEIIVPVITATKLTLNVAGEKIEYDKAAKRISLGNIHAPLELPGERSLCLRILVDKTSVELFAQDGEVQIAKCIVPPANTVYMGIGFSADGGSRIVLSNIWPMKSVWKR